MFIRIYYATSISIFVYTFIIISANSLDVYYLNNNVTVWPSDKYPDSNTGICEKALSRNHLIREPINTYTALTFLISAIFPLIFFISDCCCKTKEKSCCQSSKGILSQYPFFSLYTFLIYLGHAIGTTLNHMCACEIGLKLDNFFLWLSLPIPLVLTFFLYDTWFFNKIKRQPIKMCLLFITYGCISGILGIVAFIKTSVFVQTLITVSLLSVIMISNIVVVCFDRKQNIKRANYTLFWIVLPITLCGLLLAGLDSVLCTKNHTFGTHSLWHIIGGVFGLNLLYLYQRSIRKM